MSKFIISSEGDIERSITEIVKLAKMKGNKKLTLVLPSEGLWQVFKSSLQEELLADDVPKPVNIDADVIIL
jgi:hypothetical protein